jgi:hypothetical protein
MGLPIHVALLTGLLAAPSALQAQVDSGRASHQAGGPLASCAYDICALRIEGSSVVQGAAGQRVGGLGLFSGVAIGASVVSFIGGLFERRAKKQLARAIWWHNRELPR